MLEVKIKLNRMYLYSRRFPAKGANDIGSWESIMELISLASIPINFAILLFTTRGGKEANGGFKNTETVQYFMDKAMPGRTILEIVLILVLLEHILLAVKLLIAHLIPDVPSSVVKDETKRPKIQALAEAEML